jgi:hypothetical protein
VCPEFQQKEMMDQPAKEKSNGQVDKIEDYNKRLVDLEPDKPGKHRCDHRYRYGEKYPCLDIVRVAHFAKLIVFPLYCKKSLRNGKKACRSGQAWRQSVFRHPFSK